MTFRAATRLRGVAVLITLWSANATAVPPSLNYAGFLSDATGPVNGQTLMTFSLYDADTASVPLWTDMVSVDVQAGYFALPLGSTFNPIPSTLFAGPLYLGIQVESDPEMMPRAFVGSVPFAMHAATADTVTGDIDVGSIAVGGMPVIDSTGMWIGSPTNLQGPAGASCWDLNANGACDTPAEDFNGDTFCNVYDCRSDDGMGNLNVSGSVTAGGTLSVASADIGGTSLDGAGNIMTNGVNASTVNTTSMFATSGSFSDTLGVGPLAVDSFGNVTGAGDLQASSATIGGIGIGGAGLSGINTLTCNEANIGLVAITSFGDINNVNVLSAMGASVGGVSLGAGNITGVNNYQGSSANIGGVDITNTGDVFAPGTVGANAGNIGGISLISGSVTATSFYGELTANVINVNPGGSLNMNGTDINNAGRVNTGFVNAANDVSVGGTLSANTVTASAVIKGNDIGLNSGATGCFGRRFVANTGAFTSDGMIGGYLAADAQCGTRVLAGSVMCTYQEIIASIRCGALKLADGYGGWISSPAATDCNGWTSNASTGAAWETVGFAQVQACDAPLPIMCCI